MGPGFKLNRINPNQTQVSFDDGRFETLTDEELHDFLSMFEMSEKDTSLEQNPME